MGTYIDWDYVAEQLQDYYQDNAPPIALAYHIVLTVDLDEELVIRDRRGYLECARPKMNCVVLELGNHAANVKITREESVSLAQTLSTQIQTGIKSTLTAGLEVPGAKLGSALEASANLTKIDTRALTVTIRTAAEVSEELRLGEHAPVCQKLRVPWGFVTTLTMKGPLRVTRYYTIGARYAVTFTDQFSFDFSAVEFDVSVDAAIFTDQVKLSAEPCDCPTDPKPPPARDDTPPAGSTGGARYHTVPRRELSGSSRTAVDPAPRLFVEHGAPVLKTPAGRDAFNEDIRRIEGVDTVLGAHLSEAGLGSLSALAAAPTTLKVRGIGAERFASFIAMARLLKAHPGLSGNDAELLVRGLGIGDPDALAERRGGLDAATLREAAGRAKLPAGFDAAGLLNRLS